MQRATGRMAEYFRDVVEHATIYGRSAANSDPRVNALALCLPSQALDTIAQATSMAAEQYVTSQDIQRYARGRRV